MTDFKIELIQTLESAIPELRDKIFPGAAPDKTPTPYAAFGSPREEAVRTIHGIAGYNTTFEIAILNTTMATVESLKHQVIKALDGVDISEKRSTFRSAEYEFFFDYSLHCYRLTFKII